MRYRVRRVRCYWVPRFLLKPWRVQSTCTGKHWCTEAWCESWELAYELALDRARKDRS